MNQLEWLGRIKRYLSFKDAQSVARVCKVWYAVFADTGHQHHVVIECDAGGAYLLLHEKIRLRLPNFPFKNLAAIDVWSFERMTVSTDVLGILRTWFSTWRPSVTAFKLGPRTAASKLEDYSMPPCNKRPVFFVEAVAFLQHTVSTICLVSCSITLGTFDALAGLKSLRVLCLHDCVLEEGVAWNADSNRFLTVLSHLNAFGASRLPIRILEAMQEWSATAANPKVTPFAISLSIDTSDILLPTARAPFISMLSWNTIVDLHCFVFGRTRNDLRCANMFGWVDILSCDSGVLSRLRSLELHCRIDALPMHFLKLGESGCLTNLRVLKFGGANNVLEDGDLLRIVRVCRLIEVLHLGKCCAAIRSDFPALSMFLTRLREFYVMRSKISAPSLVALIDVCPLENLHLERCYRLEHFRKNWGQETLARFAEKAKYLKQLVVVSCKLRLDVECLAKIVDLRPCLQYLNVQGTGIEIDSEAFKALVTCKNWRAQFQVAEINGVTVSFPDGYRVETRITLAKAAKGQSLKQCFNCCTLCGSEVVVF